jgi:putative NIF3 family GTP cyclohydrolase 1 type 2
MSRISRREFVAVASAAPFVFSRRGATAVLTAQDVTDRIRKHLGVEPKPDTVDTFKAGDPATAITGVATTALATMDVLRRAVKAGANLVITCEPTFYSRADSQTPPPRRGAGPGDAGRAGENAPDPVFAAKTDFIRRQDLVVWRFSDGWRLRTPDPFAQGLVDALGWSKFREANDPSRAAIPATTLGALATHVRTRLGARGGVRVVGDPQTPVQNVAVLPGSTPIQASLKTLPAVDAIVAGEVREWESVEYARDAVAAGRKKGLLLVGRVLSEDPGMNVCATWLGEVVPELKTTWIAAGDPYWRPL